MQGEKITLFLVFGDPKRLRTVDVADWSGKAIAGPRSEIDTIIKREEAIKPGVYFLSGSDSESSEKSALYVGESENIRERIQTHLNNDNMDFWNHVIFFVSKDENLTKGHIKYLERRLLEEAHSAGRAKIINGNSSRSKLPESDTAYMEKFLNRIHQLLPILGIDALLPIGNSQESKNQNHLLYCYIKGLMATGKRTPNGFVVLKESLAVLEEREKAHNFPHTLTNRKRLIDDGTLVIDGDHFKFMHDTEFSSPSAAATVIQGGQTNGLIVWKDKDGKTLKEIEAQKSNV